MPSMPVSGRKRLNAGLDPDDVVAEFEEDEEAVVPTAAKIDPEVQLPGSGAAAAMPAVGDKDKVL